MDKFLVEPTEEGLSLLSDKDLALQLLWNQPNSVSNLYFLYSQNIDICPFSIFKLMIKTDEMDNIYNLIDSIDNQLTLNRMAEYLDDFPRYNDIYDYLIDVGAESFEQVKNRLINK